MIRTSVWEIYRVADPRYAQCVRYTTDRPTFSGPVCVRYTTDRPTLGRAGGREAVRRENATLSACFPSSAATFTIGAAAAARDPIRKLAKATVAAAVAAVIDAYRA